MDCNKDEAVRAKSIAEAKLENKDFAGAKKFALKAQNLYPGLNGISQMLTTLDVYISSQKMINGKVDWYGVLGVTSTADDETIKKQYRKLALMLHPDKNKSAGADGAFKLISEAWGLLSDKEKRSVYNLIIGRVIPSMVYPGGRCTHPNHTGGPSGPSMESRFTKFAKTKPMPPKTQKKSAKSAPAPPKPSLARANETTQESFWTMCGKCKVKYEYPNMYRNMTILCPDCKTPFMATEIPRPFKKSRAPKPNVSIPVQQQQQSPVDNSYNNNSHSRAPSSANNDWGKNVVLEAKKQGVGQGSPNISVHAQRGPISSPTGVNSACSNVAAKVTISENKLRWPMHAESNVATDIVTRKRKLDSH